MDRMRTVLALIGTCLLAACSAEPPADADQAPTPAPIAPVVKAAAPAPQPLVDLSGGVQPEFEVTTILSLDAGMRAGTYAWNAEGVAPGPMKIVVDLAAQRLYAYRGGVEIGRSSILYGADDKPTPTGVFPILQKKRHHISNLYGAPMPFMMRLTWDGVALHASTVADGFATHGCVGLPDEFAALLYAEAQLGDEVLVTNGWMKPVYWRAAPQTAEAAPVPDGLAPIDPYDFAGDEAVSSPDAPATLPTI